MFKEVFMRLFFGNSVELLYNIEPFFSFLSLFGVTMPVGEFICCAIDSLP